MCKDWNVRCINICNLWKLMCKYKKVQDKEIVVDWNVLCEHIPQGHGGLSIQVVVSTWKYMGRARQVAFVFRVLSISLLRGDIACHFGHIIQITSKWKLGMRMCDLRLCFMNEKTATIKLYLYSLAFDGMWTCKRNNRYEYMHMCVYMWVLMKSVRLTMYWNILCCAGICVWLFVCLWMIVLVFNSVCSYTCMTVFCCVVLW